MRAPLHLPLLLRWIEMCLLIQSAASNTINEHPNNHQQYPKLHYHHRNLIQYYHHYLLHHKLRANMLLLTSIPPITGPILSPLMAPITVLLPQWMLIVLFAIVPFYMWLSYWPGRKVMVVPIRASAFSPDKVPSNLDTIVIGSGSGGSSSSNILAQSGQRVLLLEQHEERTGGCTHTFRINGCEWDTGLHYTSEGMGLATHRAGALLKFMSRGKQEWKRL